MKKSDGDEPIAIADEQRAVTDETGDLVTGDVPPADVGATKNVERGLMSTSRENIHIAFVCFRSVFILFYRSVLVVQKAQSEGFYQKLR